MKWIINFLVKNLISIQSGSALAKISSAFKLAALPAVGLSISERLTGWYIERETYLIILAFSLIADLILGVWKHLEHHTFSFESMCLGFTKKLAFSIVFYFFSEAFLQILQDAKFESLAITAFLRILLLTWPAGNVMVNMGILTGGKFPPLFVLNRISKFNKTGDLKDLKNITNETENTDNNPAE
ncbi:hypothetical protein EGI16_03385 [Chryseobacterium sp. G0240]|uniref:hypothetical protein n=1 Tax=Chryseobacterium sp. G0240 TaxID=2487066 RepID=UPI000F44FEF9|nr:hypothetical protein [Chryseobacterium sp. G0240]ROI05442.1 hypothetical protein EGI16_03385 [Chryseobacterium sp. G0240]